MLIVYNYKPSNNFGGDIRWKKEKKSIAGNLKSAGENQEVNIFMTSEYVRQLWRKNLTISTVAKMPEGVAGSWQAHSVRERYREHSPRNIKAARHVNFIRWSRKKSSPSFSFQPCY